MQIAVLPVGDPSQYQGPNPRFGQPKEVACFSRDSSRKVHFDRRALRTYSAPALPVALDVGFDEYVPKSNDDEPAPLPGELTEGEWENELARNILSLRVGGGA